MTATQKTYLVTGASSGIGQACCVRLLEAGCRVIGVSRSIGAVADAKPFVGYSGLFLPIALDLSKPDQASSISSLLSAKGITLDGAVFAAGRGLFGALENLSVDAITELFQINLFAQMVLSKALLPDLKARQTGHLVFMGSEAALQGAKQGTAYCASKFGLRGFTQALRAECSTAGVKVTLINPGMVDTPFFEGLHFSPGAAPENAIQPQTIAETVWWALNTPATMQLDEISLSPRKKVVISQARNSD